jgi:hypothetical protein
LSDLDKKTVFHHTLDSKSTVATHRTVDDCALSVFVRASKAVPHLEMHETRSELNENTRGFFGR